MLVPQMVSQQPTMPPIFDHIAGRRSAVQLSYPVRVIAPETERDLQVRRLESEYIAGSHCVFLILIGDQQSPPDPHWRSAKPHQRMLPPRSLRRDFSNTNLTLRVMQLWDLVCSLHAREA
jgi:hypothetical protein